MIRGPASQPGNYFMQIIEYHVAAGNKNQYDACGKKLPESQAHGNTDIATMGAMVGFTVMMFLDVALG